MSKLQSYLVITVLSLLSTLGIAETITHCNEKLDGYPTYLFDRADTTYGAKDEDGDTFIDCYYRNPDKNYDYRLYRVKKGHIDPSVAASWTQNGLKFICRKEHPELCPFLK